MELLRWPVLIAIGFLSWIPLVRLNQYRQHERYRFLRYFVTAIFGWTIGIFYIHLSDHLNSISWVSVLLLPLIFVIICLGYETIERFMGRSTPVWLKWMAGLFFLINLGFALTNEIHLLYRSMPMADLQDKAAIIFAPLGPFFYIHTAVSYGVIASIVFKLFKYLRTKQQDQAMQMPLRLMVIIVLFGLLLNIVHVFFYTFYVDISYLFIVVFGYYVYWLVFNRDFHLRLMSTGRAFLVDAMREMYIIIDQFGQVVEYATSLAKKIQLSPSATNDIDSLMAALHKQAVVFSDFEQLRDKTLETKPYFFRTDQVFSLPKFKQKGTLILLFDETETVKLLDCLNYAVRHDMMTGLLNRSTFERAWEHYDKHHSYAGIIISDVNGLKRVNDTLGHRQGDQLIKAYATLLKEKVHTATAMYRFGGDEFLIYFEKATPSQLKTVQKTLHEAAEKTDFPSRISVSSGYAIRQEQESLESVLQRADQALYAMKKQTAPAFHKLFDHWISTGQKPHNQKE